jgi:hypothetical protein
MIACLLATPVARLAAVDMGGVAIHGSLSGTAAYSDQYNYYGSTDNKVDVIQKELTVNGAYRFENGLRTSAQIYAYELDGYQALTLDFANLDYSFRQEFGVRAGRNKLPLGFYNEVQDLDQVRTFASLPLSFYPRAARALGASLDGVTLYGNINLKPAGNLDYQLYAGVNGPLDSSLPLMQGIGATELKPHEVVGGSLVWNTMVDGLRLGYSCKYLPNIDMVRGIPIEVKSIAHVLSAEYTWGKWVAATEFKRSIGRSYVPAFGASSTSHQDDWYAQLTYQATDKLGLGAYYGRSFMENKGVDNDIAIAASYALQPWWLVKAELHAIEGIANLGIAGDSNPGATDKTWNYFVVKTTLSF